jgi:tetratricopeptide (TPR) repeat protein
MNDDKTVYKKPAPCRVKIIKGIDKGKEFPLYLHEKYTIGRGKDCEILIDGNDKKASRKHALLSVEEQRYVLENLSETNPTIVKGKRIDRTVLKKRGRFQVGSTVLMLEPYERKGPPAKKGLKFLRITAVFVVILAVILVFVYSRTNQPQTEQSTEVPRIDGDKEKGNGEKKNETERNNRAIKPYPPKSGEPIDISTADREKADEHFRNGRFFFDAGKLLRAIEEWDQALELDRNHRNAKKWRQKAEAALEKSIDEHYKSALRAVKYMRYQEAIHELKIVIRLSRNQEDYRYINAVKQLEELGER